MSRGPCMFGSRCYRRNPQHFLDYSHAHLDRLQCRVSEDEAVAMDNTADTLNQQLAVVANLEQQSRLETRDRSPHRGPNEREGSKDSNSKSRQHSLSSLGLFLTKVKDSPETHRDRFSLYFTRLLHPSLGQLRRSLQVNFMVEWDWLRMNYEQMKLESKDLLIIHGDKAQAQDLAKINLPNVKVHCVTSKYPYGTHHTKMMLFQYDDESVRVVVHTANLIGSDWTNRVQGLWVSPKCPLMEGKSESEEEGDSETHFKRDLLRYLKFYEISALNVYIKAVQRCDFSQVKVVLIGSVPNAHKGPDLHLWGLNAVKKIIQKHGSPPCSSSDESPWPLVLQCSSIGSLGPTPQSWFKDGLVSSLTGGEQDVKTKVIYPSQKNVVDSYDGILGGGCLPYSGRTHEKQVWLEQYMHQWKADKTHRTRAMPHIKSYARLDAKGEKAAMFLLTSANISKAAWGSMSKKGDSQLIMSYELGVLFLPKFFDKTFFKVDEDLRLPYDWPLVPYGQGQGPWFSDYLRASLS